MAKPPLASILIVEDDGELLEVLKFVLEDAGYKVAGAPSGEEGLRLIASEPVDLIVLDVNMKGMSGLDVARQLRAQPTGSELLIALHTGKEESAVKKDFADYDLFMPKVDDADALLTMIAGVLSKRNTRANAGAAAPISADSASPSSS